MNVTPPTAIHTNLNPLSLHAALPIHGFPESPHAYIKHASIKAAQFWRLQMKHGALLYRRAKTEMGFMAKGLM